jgi:PAS domain S-box-containing protein
MYSVLYVDDEDSLLELCRIFLEKTGDFHIDIARSAQEALEKMLDISYDAIVSDYQMPEMDGIEFLKEIRSRSGDIPFILFTGRGREQIVIEAINNGADFYLQKGGDPGSQFAELAHKIRKAVERKKAIDALRKNDEQLKLLRESVERASDEVYWLDFAGRILSVNDTACRNTGYTQDELLAMTVFELDPDWTPGMQAESKVILKEKKTRVFTTRHRHKDGSIIDVEIMTNFVERDGREYSLAFARDITRRKQTEDALRESEERYRRLLAQSFDAVILHQNGNIVFANDAAARLVKAPGPAEMVGRPTLDFVDPRCSGLVSERIRIMQETGSAVPLVEERFRCLDGTTVDVEVIATGAVYEGKPAVQVVARDISGRKRAEKALLAANRQLTLLTSITRHDILNKVTVMAGYLKLLDQMLLDPVAKEYVRHLGASTRSIGEHIGFTAIYQDIRSAEPKWHALMDVLPISRIPTGITFSAGIGDVSVYADPILGTIFFNLLDNSLRHAQGLTAIRVSAYETPDGLTVAWEDDGPGIPAPEKEKIFRQGYGKNTGLGLFLSREILTTTGITISENGVPGKGARFEMRVPKGGYRYGTDRK